MVEAIVAASPGPDVVDVGCGTGIVARQFQAAGCTVLGVDADERIAEFARRRGLDVEVATFEAWDPAGRTFECDHLRLDLALGGSGRGSGEGGRGAAAWRPAGRVLERVPAFAPGGAGVRRCLPPSDARRPFFPPVDNRLGRSSALCATATAGIRAAGSFGDPGQWRFHWERSYTRDQWLDQLPTAGDTSQFPPVKLEQLLAGIGAAIDTWGGSFTMRYTAVVVTATRCDPAT